MPWIPSLPNLDADQRDFVDTDYSGQKIWLRGFAGTGKSVLIVIKLQEIYSNDPNARVCIISFTHALLEAFRLGFDETGLSNRASSGIRSNKCQARKGEIDLVTKYEFHRNQSGPDRIDYDYVYVDEIQDLCPSDARSISTLTEFIIAGDENQSIYTEDPQTKEPIITREGITNIISPRVHDLKTMHRLTPAVINTIKVTVPDLNSYLSGLRFGHTRNSSVLVCHANDEEDEARYVYDQAMNYAADVELTAILFPMHSWIQSFCKYIINYTNAPLDERVQKMIMQRDYTSLNRFFWQNDINLEYVGNNHGSFIHARENNNIILMTYHSSKGMDFENVFLPFLSVSRFEGFGYFLPKPLMVAMTRTKLNLTLSYSGEPLQVVQELLNEVDSSDWIDSIDIDDMDHDYEDLFNKF